MPLRSTNPWSDPDPTQIAGYRRADAAPRDVCDVHFDGVAGLVFDAGDVLFDATAWRRWLLQQLSRIGLQSTYRSFFSIWDREYLDDVHCGRREYADAFVGFLRGAGLTEGQIDEIVLASAIRKRELETDVRPFPGVSSTLWRLHAEGFRLAVLSDSESTGKAIHARLETFGIGGCFSAVVSSADLGRTKPAIECYRHAASLLHLSASQTAFVGHDAEELTGARRAGMRVIAFNFDQDAVAERYLQRFDDLISVLPLRSSLTYRPSKAA